MRSDLVLIEANNVSSDQNCRRAMIDPITASWSMQVTDFDDAFFDLPLRSVAALHKNTLCLKGEC